MCKVGVGYIRSKKLEEVTLEATLEVTLEATGAKMVQVHSGAIGGEGGRGSKATEQDDTSTESCRPSP